MNAPATANRSADQDAFARALGFESYLAMFETTQATNSPDGTPWLITALPGGQWVAWNKGNLEDYRKFATRDEATDFVSAGVA